MKSAPPYAVDTISDYRNKRPAVWTPDTLPYWCSKLPRASNSVHSYCLYALLSGLIITNEHFNLTNENEIRVLTLLRAVEKVAETKWWLTKLVGDYKKGFTFEGLVGV